MCVWSLVNTASANYLETHQHINTNRYNYKVFDNHAIFDEASVAPTQALTGTLT